MSDLLEQLRVVRERMAELRKEEAGLIRAISSEVRGPAAVEGSAPPPGVRWRRYHPDSVGGRMLAALALSPANSRNLAKILACSVAHVYVEMTRLRRQGRVVRSDQGVWSLAEQTAVAPPS